MSKTTSTNVWRAYEHGKLRVIALSEDQLHLHCPECTEPGWKIACSIEQVVQAQGVVINWAESGEPVRNHVHWKCPLCGEEHMSDFDPHADSNPVLWFCEGVGNDDMCLVSWHFEVA